mmetsp:Transcript_19337/g.53912  ORF Transcript_19337/g.53912 Transcript_19337/m.53912 type:complete len:250 (-) Transcript_19337:2254-3003(-)
MLPISIRVVHLSKHHRVLPNFHLRRLATNHPLSISTTTRNENRTPTYTFRTMSTAATPTDSTLATQSVQNFCDVLSSKQPTPGGGASAAVGAAIGAGTAAMSGAYTQRKKDEESGAAEAARTMISKMNISSLLSMADDDVKAYQSLQSTWKKDSGLTLEEVKEIEANALKVPTVLLEACHERIVAVQEFLPKCNPNITSDAKVGIHQLAGAARSAYQTILVNSPPEEEKERLMKLLREIQEIENGLLGL